MPDDGLIAIKPDIAAKAHVTADKRAAMYAAADLRTDPLAETFETAAAAPDVAQDPQAPALHATARCTPHPERTLLLRASEREHAQESGLVGGWEALVVEMAVRDMPGNHFTLVAPANVPAVAAALREGLGLGPA